MTMRAAVFKGVGLPLQIEQLVVPQPAPGQLLIRVHRCGICGSDVHLTDEHAHWQVPVGTVMGHEFVGEVVALGEGTQTQWKEGDRLAALPMLGCGKCAHCIAGEPFHCPSSLRPGLGDLVGGFSEYAIVGAREAARMGAGLSWEEGAFTEPLAVAIHALARARMQPGARVLVMGAGPIGLCVAAFARACGAGSVVVSARSDSNADLARRMGATEFLPNDEYLAERFARIAGGPPELVIECTGATGLIDRCASLAALKGTVIVAGGCNGVDPLSVLVPTVKELSLHFIICYTLREFDLALRLIETGAIDPLPMLSSVIPLDGAPAALESLRTGTSACKLMIDPTA